MTDPVMPMRPGDLDAALLANARRRRHELHRIPETGLVEHRTSDYLADELAAMGLPITRGIGGTGLVATIQRSPAPLSPGGSLPAIGLRAEMDGLPLPESVAREYGSQHEGVMHACGHDGHMAMVLGAAELLIAQGGFEGEVHLVFQPAEEHGLGATAMIRDGLFERFGMQAIFGLHNFPGQAAGAIFTRAGGFMASEDNFEITINGRGGHASQPQLLVDPIVIAAELIAALQTIVARNVHPAQTAVLSCTEITTDGARNAVPSTVVIRGDTRSFSAEVQTLLERRIRELSQSICAAHGATCTVSYTHEFEPTINDADATATALVAARQTVGEELVDGDCPPVMGSEDFGVFGQVVPACFAGIGNGTTPGAGGTPLHSHDYDFNDDILATGIAYYVNLVRASLPPSR